jgi:hypothetical protein
MIDNHDEFTGANDATKDPDGIVKLVSRGTSANGERIVEVMIKGSNNWYGFFGRDGVTLSGGSTVDSFTATFDPLNLGQSAYVASNGSVTLSGNGTRVSGDVSAGATVNTNSGAAVTGTTTNGAPPVTYPAIDVCGPPYSASTGMRAMTGCSPITNCYNSTTGVLSIAGGSSLALADGTYCFSSVSLSGGSTLQVDGPVMIYLTADSNFSGGSLVNTTLDAWNLQISSSFDSGGATNTGIKLSGGGLAYFTFNGPNCAVTWSGNSDYFGAIISSNIKNTGGTKMHYAKGLITRTHATVIGWHEVRGQ